MRQPGSDSVSPNLQTVNSKGEQVAEFEGHVKAKGLELPESLTGVLPLESNANSILEWVTEAGLLREFILGGFPWSLILHAGQSGTLRGDAFMYLHSAQTNVDTAYAKVVVNEIEKVLCNSDEGSDFLQMMVGPVKRRYADGNIEASFAGGTSIIDFTVSHGLEGKPRKINVTCDSSVNGGSLYNFTTTILEVTEVKFKVRCTISDGFIPAAGTKMRLFWDATI